MNSFNLFPLALIAASQEICYLPLDVMFLQDTTGSFDDDLPNVVRQIPEMVDAILAEHPESWFGVAEFKDKPYYPLGESSDFCYKLGDGKLAANMEDFNWAYSGLYASGGGDLPESQMQALIDLAYDAGVGWRPLANLGMRAASGQAGARLVIMSTDAVPHLPGDIDNFDPVQYPDLPRNLPPNSGTISTGDVNYECLNQDYPDPQQMKAALAAKNIYLAILTPNDPAIVSAWQWVNEDLLGQPSDFYQFISADSSDLLKGVLDAIEAVTAYLCPTTTIPPTTTALPTTLAPTTLAPTTPTTTTTNAATTPTSTTTTTTMSTTTTTTTTTTSSTTPTPSTAAPSTATTMPATPATTASSVTIAPMTTMPATSTTSDAQVTPAGSTQMPPLTPTESAEMPITCPPCEHPCSNPCQCCPALVVKVAEKPSYLRIDYQK